jgi:hypothetical protein
MDKDYRLGSVTITRIDTGEVIRERPMSAEERQMELPSHKKEKPVKTKSKGEMAEA